MAFKDLQLVVKELTGLDLELTEQFGTAIVWNFLLDDFIRLNIREINNPRYAVVEDNGKLIEPLNREALDIVLHIQTEELFAFMNTLNS